MSYSLTHFFKDKYAALRKHKTILFMILLSFIIFSLYLIFAASFQVSTDITTIQPRNTTYTKINFTVNNTQTPVNVTNVTLTFPSGWGFGFNAATNGSSPRVAGNTGQANFSVNGLTVSWENATDGVINSSANRSFWININSSLEGTLGINLTITYNNYTMSSYNYTVTVSDTVAPTASNILPGGSNFTSDTTPTIYINITDLGMGVNSSEIVMEISRNGNPLDNITEINAAIGYDSGSTTGEGFMVSYTYSTPLVGGDNLTIRVNAKDNSSNMNAMTEAKWNITIDTAVPNITIISPSANTNLTGSADNITAQVTDNWGTSINTSDVFAALKNNSGYYALGSAATNRTGDYRNWTNLDQSGTSDFFNATLNSGIFKDGTYTLYVNATDLAGNLRENTSIKITIDNIDPSAFALTEPANNTNSTDTTPTLTWEATTETNFINYTVQVDDSPAFDTPINVTGITSIGSGTVTTTLSNELGANTAYYWRVTARDAAGNTRVSSYSYFVYTTDNTAPTVAVDTPSGDVNLTGTADNVTVTVGENVSAVYAALRNGTGGTIHYYKVDDGTEATGDFTTWTALKHSRANIWYNTTLNSGNFADGTYILYVNATDMANNNGTNYDRTITIDNTVPSTFDIVQPADGTVNTDRTPEFKWEPTVEQNFINYSVEIDDTSDTFGSIIAKYNTTTNATNSTTATSDLDTDATYYWRVKAWDAAGNTKTSTSSFTYTTDQTNPVVAIEVANNTNVTASNVNITANVTDVNINISDVFAALYNSSGSTAHYYKLDGTQATGDYRTWTNLKRSGTTTFFNSTLNADNFVDGSYLLYVNASDNASNVAQNKSINITIDNTAPTYTNLLPGVANFTNTQFPTFFINISDASTYVDNNTISVWVQVNTGSPVNRTDFTNGSRKNINGGKGIQVSYTFTDPLANGDVVYANVSAKDIVGNNMGIVNWSFTVDRVSPQLLMEAPANQTNQTVSNVNITIKVTDTNRNNSDVWAALRNGTGETIHYYKVNDGTEATGDYRTWTNLKRSGSTDFFNSTLNADSFADGEYRLYINATDLGGSTTENKSYILHIDNIAPYFTDMYPVNNSNTTASDIGFIFNVTDQIDTDMVCNISITNDTGTNVTYINIIALNQSSDDTSSVINQTGNDTYTNGRYTWYVTCADDTGHSNSSYVRTIYVETAAPTVALTAPANHYNQSSTTIEFSWTTTSSTYSNIDCNISIDLVNATVVVTNGTNSNWYDKTGASEGVHNWSVHCWTPLWSVFSGNRTVTVDATAPKVTAQLLADEANTSSTTPTFEVNVSDNLAANFTCTLYVGGGTTSYGTDATVNNDTAGDASERASITASTIAAGTHTWYINCSDYAGNTGKSATRTLTVDISAPGLSIKSPANNTNQTILEGVNLTVQVSETNWNISDVYAALKLGSTYYNLNGTPVTGDYQQWSNLLLRAGTSFNATLNASNFSDGAYTIYANTSDAAGNLGTASVMKIVIDKTAPVIQNATYNNASVGQEIGIAVNVSDATSGVFDVNMTTTSNNCSIYFNNTFMAYAPYSSSKGGCNTTFTVPGTFTAGNYTLGINATDWAGNNQSNFSYKIQVFADTESPRVSMTAPSANYTNQSSTSLTVAWTATDNIDTSLVCNISIINGTVTGSAPTNSTGNITTSVASAGSNSTTLTGMNNSKYNISVSCWDDAINQNVTSSIIGLLIDNVAPVVEITTTNNTNVSATVTTFNFNVSDSYSTNFTCELFFGATSKGVNASNVVNSTSAEQHTINSSAISSEGNYLYYINCTDYADNTGQSAKKIINFDTSVPSVIIVTPSANSYNRTNLQINVSAVDTYTNVSAVRYRLSGATTTAWTDMTQVNATHYNATFDTTSVGDGSYYVQIYANDTLNNTNMTEKVAIVVDNTAPSTVVGNTTGSRDPAASFAINVTVFDNRTASSITLYSILYKCPSGYGCADENLTNSTTLTGTSGPAATEYTGTINRDVTGYGDIIWNMTYYITGYDYAGNAITNGGSKVAPLASFIIQNDSTAPTMTVNTPDNATLTTQSIAINLTTSEAATCKLDNRSRPYSAMAFTMTGASTNHNYTWAVEIDAAAYTFYINCQDASGNSQGTPTSIVVNVDTRGNYNITRPSAIYTYFTNNTWNAFALPLWLLQNTTLSSTTSYPGGYNASNVLASLRGNYSMLYAYTGSTWSSYVPGDSVNSFGNFTYSGAEEYYYVKINRTNERLEIN